ncbi:zinc finger protein [Macleaya cordata]|uniref:Zinc finger protein n=1 Tax=Macleaya cordata TaxID=56857 RepID=A0A200QDC0_MACCD|nr:zinc finger protein [Macleaya cordata]
MAEGAPFAFRHRRSHLKSETVGTLLRILSLCVEESQSSHPHPIVSDALNPGVHNEELERITQQESQNEILLIENDLLSNKSVEVISIEPSTLVVEKDMIIDEVVASINNHCDLVEESRQGDEEIKIDKHLNFEILGAIKPAEDTEVGLFSSEQNVVEEVAHEMQQKETGLTKPVNLDTTMDCSVCLITDMEIEDGEIPDDTWVYGQSIDLFHEDSALLEEMKVGGDQNLGEVIRKSESDNVEKHVASTFCRASTTDSMNSIQEELKRKSGEKHDRDDILGYKRSGDVEQADGDDGMLEARRNAKGGGEAKGVVNLPQTYLDNLGYSFKTSDNIMTDDQGSAPKVKDTKGGDKIKRVLTKERKAKKKRNERKRRAEKNKEQGVKRLKIVPILKPKVVKYCEFFLKGRCQKGDSCKFSHDTIPLTKSEPCTFFARNSCMKGDDCPFDHQLSKYPCNNYVSKGDCIRGDKCLFSHKLVESRSPSSNIKQTEAGSQSLLGNSNTKRNQTTKNTHSQTLNNISKETSLRTPSSAGTLVQRNSVENMSGRLKTPAYAPKGVTFLSFGNAPTHDSSNRDVQKDQKASGKPQNSNELLWKMPATPLPLCRSSTNPSPNGQNKNSAERALTSTLAFAAKYEAEMMKGRSICSTDLITEANKASKSSTSSSIDNVQNGWMKASPILQEFLFGVGGDGKL